MATRDGLVFSYGSGAETIGPCSRASHWLWPEQELQIGKLCRGT